MPLTVAEVAMMGAMLGLIIASVADYSYDGEGLYYAVESPFWHFTFYSAVLVITTAFLISIAASNTAFVWLMVAIPVQIILGRPKWPRTNPLTRFARSLVVITTSIGIVLLATSDMPSRPRDCLFLLFYGVLAGSAVSLIYKFKPLKRDWNSIWTGLHNPSFNYYRAAIIIGAVAAWVLISQLGSLPGIWFAVGVIPTAIAFAHPGQTKRPERARIGIS